MGNIAVIDTETNWADAVMSIGTVVADSESFTVTGQRYHVLTAECVLGGMYEDVLFLPTPAKPILCTRQEALVDLRDWLEGLNVETIFAYNALFDRRHLPELSQWVWRDIMARAAYRQHNPKIPKWAECCTTGRLKRGYGVEPMLRLLSGNRDYRETHNALLDAMDELEFLRLLGQNDAAGAYHVQPDCCFQHSGADREGQALYGGPGWLRNGQIR